MVGPLDGASNYARSEWVCCQDSRQAIPWLSVYGHM